MHASSSKSFFYNIKLKLFLLPRLKFQLEISFIQGVSKKDDEYFFCLLILYSHVIHFWKEREIIHALFSTKRCYTHIANMLQQ